MKKLGVYFCLLLLLLSLVACKNTLPPTVNEKVEESEKDQEIVEVEEIEEVEEEYTYVIDGNGDLQVTMGDQIKILDINALQDSRIIKDEQERLLLLTNPTDRYQHGILGDKIEATSVTLVQLSAEPTVISQFFVPEDQVIESIQPIWSDWDGDGVREILLTLSNASEGATLVLYDEKGTVLAESLPVGTGYRWRHALEIASFGENGQRLLVDVITPHIGGIVSFYSWDQEKKVLKTEATLAGYSTHDIGSRMMDMYAVQVDDQNEQALLILPSQSKTELAGLRFTDGVIHEEWRILLNGRLSSNLELIHRDGIQSIRCIVDDQEEVILNLPE